MYPKIIAMTICAVRFKKFWGRLIIFSTLVMSACVPKAAYDKLNYEFVENQKRLENCRIKEQRLDADLVDEEQYQAQKKGFKVYETNLESYTDLRDRLERCSKSQMESCIGEWRLNQESLYTKSVEEWKLKVRQKEAQRDTLNEVIDSLKYKWYYIDSCCRANNVDSTAGAAEKWVSVENQLPLKEKILRAFVQDSFYLKSQFNLLKLKNDTAMWRYDECIRSTEKKKVLLEEMSQSSADRSPLADFERVRQTKQEIEAILGDPYNNTNKKLYSTYRLAEKYVNSANDPRKKLLTEYKQRHQILTSIVTNRQNEHNKWALFIDALERDCPTAGKSYQAYIEDKYKPVDSIVVDSMPENFLLRAREMAQKVFKTNQAGDTIAQDTNGVIEEKSGTRSTRYNSSTSPSKSAQTGSTTGTETATSAKNPVNEAAEVRKVYVPKITADDADGDGIPNEQDECPYTKAQHLPVDSRGCSLINFDKDECGIEEDMDDEQKGPVVCDCMPCSDDDEDGVFNYEDKCPDKKGHRDNRGCPLVLTSAAIDSISYPSRSFEAGAEDLELLRENITLYRQKFKESRFKVIGLGDYSDASPMHFASKRVNGIVEKLKEWGVPSETIWSEPQEHNPAFRLSRAVYIYAE